MIHFVSYLDLTFVLGDTKVRLPAANSTFQRHACAAAATRVKYKIVHKKIIQIAAAGSLRLNTLWEGADTQVTVAKAEQ